MGCGLSRCQRELCLIRNTDKFKDGCKFLLSFVKVTLAAPTPTINPLCTFTKKYFILASLVLPQNLATLRNHLVHPVDQISPGYSVSFLQLMSTIFHKTSTYHSVSCKEMENVYFFLMHIWNISLAGSNTTAWVLFRLPKFMWVVSTWKVLGSVLPNFKVPPNFSVHLPIHACMVVISFPNKL
jgi:hypothetical protein